MVDGIFCKVYNKTQIDCETEENRKSKRLEEKAGSGFLEKEEFI